MRTISVVAVSFLLFGEMLAQPATKIFARVDCTKTEGQKTLSIKASASESSETVVAIPCDNDVIVLGTVNDWAMVKTGADKTGYLPSRFLRPLNSNSLTPGIPPKILLAPDPDYSREAREKGIEGTVEIALVLGVDGLPHDLVIKKKLGYGLDEKAIEAVKKWKFKPAERDGQPVETKMYVEVNFRLY